MVPRVIPLWGTNRQGDPFSRRGCARVLRATKLQSRLPPANKREAERRKAHSIRGRPLFRPLLVGGSGGGGSGPIGARSPSGAPRAALVAASERRNSVQAALRASGRTQALPAPSFALKQGTLRPGRDAGGDDARTARERGYKPRPQEPHPLHRRLSPATSLR
jgi:hypothetical protein